MLMPARTYRTPRATTTETTGEVQLVTSRAQQTASTRARETSGHLVHAEVRACRVVISTSRSLRTTDDLSYDVDIDTR
jgi:hypothetical protein